MRAVVWTEYGSPDGPHLAEVERPVLRPGHVLIRVHATTVTAGDSESRRLKIPLPLRLPFRSKTVGPRRSMDKGRQRNRGPC